MNYFRSSVAPSGLPIAACAFAFDERDLNAAHTAYEAARAVAAEARGHVVAWRKPRAWGPWSGPVCAEVGDTREVVGA